jgi:hypothetical protein
MERNDAQAGKSGPAAGPDVAPGLQDAGADDSEMDSPDDASQPATDDGREPAEQKRPTDQPSTTAVKTAAEATDRKSSPGSDSTSPAAAAGRVPDGTKAKGEGRPAATATPVIRLTPELRELGQRIRRCLAFYYYRPESASERSPWGVMHYAIGFGVDAQLNVGDDNVNALAWLCGNRSCNGLRMFTTDRRGGLDVRLGPGYQGHEGQFLSVLALTRVQPDYPLTVADQKLTIADLVQREQRTCRVGTELTFKLIGLSHYLDSDAQWVASDDQRWDIPRLIREEIAQPVIGSACGGTHRLIGLAYAVNRRERVQRPVTGQWLRAKQYVASYQQYTFKLQNRDGSFSTKWFEGRAHSGDLNRYLNTTGHALEWLTFSLPKDQLTDPRLVRMVSFLENLMWENRTFRWDIGPKGHALRALGLYDEYVFGGQPGQRAVQLAEALRDKRLR